MFKNKLAPQQDLAVNFINLSLKIMNVNQTKANRDAVYFQTRDSFEKCLHVLCGYSRLHERSRMHVSL